MKFTLIHQDKNLLVADKPSGMLCASDRSGNPGLREYLQKRYGEVFLTHRIDRETSGVILFARNVHTHSILSEQFSNHKIRKSYEAIVLGTPEKDTLAFPLKTIKTSSFYKSIIDKNGRESITKIIEVDQMGPFAHIHLELITGRMHQIRAHCAHAGFPLVGDPFYGGPEHFLLSQVKRKYNKKDTERPLLSRVALHASAIHISAPELALDHRFTSVLPKDMRATIAQCKKNFS